MVYLPLKTKDEIKFKFREERVSKTCEELEIFLEDLKHLNTKSFAKEVMFSHELKANNLIEGYTDDILVVEEIIKNRAKKYNPKQIQRIKNLYHGYNYILKDKEINKENLKKLYHLLAKDLLNPNDLNRMGEYYRLAPVYILNKGRLDTELSKGIEFDLIEDYMKSYFDFLNTPFKSNSSTDEYIKSQILHFYFVYIHPYFDVNGRTSRTLSMWYLLNKKVYPYIIFNRGITFRGSKYDTSIQDVIKYHDISFFIDYMLKTVHSELEKEYIMLAIAAQSSKKFTATDYQTILYLLTMNSILSVKDFATIYNSYNTKKSNKEIYLTMIEPLIKHNILQVKRTTTTNMFDNYPNEILEFNPHIMNYNHNKIKTLTKYK